MIIKIIKSKFNLPNSIYKLNIAVTYRCNSRCRMCNIWKKSHSHELGIDDFETLFQKNKIEWLSLTGGEPFLRNDIVNIIDLAIRCSKTKIINIPSNGFLTDKIIHDVQSVLSRHPKINFGISISIDGLKECHNDVRGLPFAWDRSFATMRALKKIQKQYKNFHVFINCTITPHTIDHIYSFIEFIESDSLLSLKDIHFNFYQTSEIYYANKKTPLTQDIEYKDTINKIIRFFLSRGSSHVLEPISLIDRRYLALYTKFNSTSIIPLPCKSGIASMFLDPFGDIYPCINFNYPLGNIKDKNIQYIIKNIQKTVKFKKCISLIQQKKCPRCWTSCEAFQTILSNLSIW